MTKVAALCSGYGGIELGLAMVESIDVIWHAEIEPAPAAIHQHHWPNAPNVGDISVADWASLERPDLLTAGYPCQPFSTAGRRKGSDDPRHLWPHVATAVRVLRPRRVLLENVAGHRTLGFGDVLADLASLGYDARWGCVRASDAGAPHRRERLFVVAADAGGAGTGRDARSVPGSVQGRTGVDVRAVGDDRRALADAGGSVGRWPGHPERRDGGTADGRRGAPEPRGRGGAPADPDGQRLVRGKEPDERAIEPGQSASRRRDAERLDLDAVWGTYEPAIRRWEHLTRPAPRPTDDRGRLSPEFVEWMMGLPAGWVTGHGLPRTAELKMLGNGVVPQAAALAWAHLTDTQEVAA